MGQGSPGSEHQGAVRDLRDLVVDRPHGLEGLVFDALSPFWLTLADSPWVVEGPRHGRGGVQGGLDQNQAEVSKLTDDFKDVVGPATLKLLDALAEYLDSEFEDR